MKKTTKIVVPVLMVVVVLGIWLVQRNAAVTPTDGDFDLHVSSIDLAHIQSLGLPVIIDFGADECIPCKEMAPVLVSLNEETRGEAIIKFLDVWKYPEAAQGLPLTVIPTQLFFEADGSPYVPSDDLGIEVIMYADSETGEHIYTTHQGGLTEEQMKRILADMEPAV